MSKIEWTDKTLSPFAGCSRVSPGCGGCYAERMAHRLAAMGQEKYEGTTYKSPSGVRWTGRVNFEREVLGQLFRWRRGYRIFLNPMSDVFHPNASDADILEILAHVALATQHSIQVLTKRPERAYEYLSRPGLAAEVFERARVVAFDEWTVAGRTGRIPEGARLAGESRESRSVELRRPVWPLPNLWLGTSAEDQPRADERVEWILRAPAAVRFVSYEPALGPIDLSPYLRENSDWCQVHGHSRDPESENECETCGDAPHLAPLIDWVIAGGESGPGARPAHPDWFRSVRDQCVGARVPFFFKQHGEWIEEGQLGNGKSPQRAAGCRSVTLYGERGRGDAQLLRVGKAAAGRKLDGLTWEQFPEVAA